MPPGLWIFFADNYFLDATSCPVDVLPTLTIDVVIKTAKRKPPRGGVSLLAKNFMDIY